MDLQAIPSIILIYVTAVGGRILAAIAFWIVGRWLIAKVIALLQEGMSVNNVDATPPKHLGSNVAVALNIALVLGILGFFGVETTSFAAGAFMLVLRPVAGCNEIQRRKIVAPNRYPVPWSVMIGCTATPDRRMR